MLTAITGINWGDEGKGRMVDLLSRDYDIVARYQGGDNAGHTVKNERGKFVFGICHDQSSMGGMRRQAPRSSFSSFQAHAMQSDERQNSNAFSGG